ncbi:hypothetical protein AXF42_Ash014517 [Apostasia shenzhenica]|uniref:Uncharacterized protein n=1 Tax=Apostasia shenzhenica TaxID=1088818 RepID=A0A2H9ZWQ2_9ASPA|nr:hypothetical protein AXF42_Ash014517 [Apostasia shenzhenica]
MGFLRRIGAILGFVRDEAQVVVEEGEGPGDSPPRRRGFSIQVPVAIEKHNVGPVLVPCSLGEGGVQGFRWYSRRLRIDEDGDVADEFLDEVLLPMSSDAAELSAQPRFEVKYTTRPAPVRKQAISLDGNVHPCMEYQGMLRWV